MNPNLPKLLSLAGASTYTGLSKKMLANGMRTGEIPVTLRMIGRRRQQFVSAAELEAWLATSRPAVDLFATAEVAA